jgi:hypothetical protein
MLASSVVASLSNAFILGNQSLTFLYLLMIFISGLSFIFFILLQKPKQTLSIVTEDSLIP